MELYACVYLGMYIGSSYAPRRLKCTSNAPQKHAGTGVDIGTYSMYMTYPTARPHYSHPLLGPAASLIRDKVFLVYLQAAYVQ